MTEPIRLSLEVDCSTERAFHVWTALMSRWWPADHTVTVEPDLDVIFEPRVGGRIFERTAAGAEHDWGEVRVWEPPSLVVYSWHLRADRADATEVEIRFVPMAGGGGTRLEIEHRKWERLGDRGIARRDANFGGWRTLLPHYVDAIAEGLGGATV